VVHRSSRWCRLSPAAGGGGESGPRARSNRGRRPRSQPSRLAPGASSGAPRDRSAIGISPEVHPLHPHRRPRPRRWCAATRAAAPPRRALAARAAGVQLAAAAPRHRQVESGRAGSRRSRNQRRSWENEDRRTAGPDGGGRIAEAVAACSRHCGETLGDDRGQPRPPWRLEQARPPRGRYPSVLPQVRRHLRGEQRMARRRRSVCSPRARSQHSHQMPATTSSMGVSGVRGRTGRSASWTGAATAGGLPVRLAVGVSAAQGGARSRRTRWAAGARRGTPAARTDRPRWREPAAGTR